MGFGEVGFEGDGLATSGHGLIYLALVFQGDAEVAKRFEIFGIDGDGLAVRCDGLIHLALVTQDIAEIVVGFG